MDRKGTVADSVYLVITLFAVAMMIVLGYKVFDSANDHLQDTDNIPQSGKDVSQNFYDSYVTVFDYGFLTILVFLFLATVILGAMVNTSPILFFLSTFLTLTVIVLAAIFANAYDEFQSTSQMSVYAAQFTIIPFVMQHFVVIISVFLLVVAGITYMRVRA